MPTSHLKYVFLLFIIANLPVCLLGQISIDTLHILILNEETKETLPGATVFNVTTKEGETSDNFGRAKIKVQSTKDIIEISFLGFTQKAFEATNLPDTVFMSRSSNVIENITITSERKLIPITEKTETICDFVADGKYIIMLSRTGMKRHVLKLLGLGGDFISTTSIPKLRNIEGLYTSCFGSHFLIGGAEVLELYILNDQIRIIDRNTRQRFNEFIVPCLEQNEKFIYLEKKKIKNQIATIVAYPKSGEEPFVFGQVADHQNLERYKYEAPYMNFADGTGPLYLGVHAENARDALQYGDMLNRSFYLPVDYYMLNHENKILLIDYEKGKFNTLDWKGNLISQHDISFPNQKGATRNENLYYDQLSQKLYLHYINKKHNLFSEIDLETGACLSPVAVKAEFIENMTIHNGVVYFTNSSLVQSSRILNMFILD